MSEQTVVHFETDGPEADERLIREYVLDAMERLPETDACSDVGFLRYGHEPTTENGEVRLHLAGDVDAIVAAEREHWDTLVKEEFAREWYDAGPEDDTETFGEQGAALVSELQFLASEMSVPVFERFGPEDQLAPVDTFHEEGPVPAGWWTLLHFLADQQGFSAREESGAYVEGIRNRVWSVWSAEGVDAAEARIDELEAELDAMRKEVRQFETERSNS